MPSTASLIANGTVGITTAAILTAGDSTTPISGRVDAIFFNTGGNTETVNLTFNHGGTDRQFFRFELGQYESFKITALPIQGGDVFSAGASDAAVVNYLIFNSESKVLTLEVYSANGTGKATGILRQILQSLEQAFDAETLDPG